MKKLKLVIFNGSPKGDSSITLRYILYLKKLHNQYEYKIFNVGQDIKRIEKDLDYFYEIMKKVEEADAIFWVYPVYYTLVPSQLKRFIELIWENRKQDSFENKYATSISTSAHFYDHTAHNYIHAISEDLSMYYIDGFSADMWDFLNVDIRENFLGFIEYFFHFITNQVLIEGSYQPITWDRKSYSPQFNEEIIKEIKNQYDSKITIISDVRKKDTNLQNMIQVFLNYLPNNVVIINLNELNIKGGCLGCMNCAFNGTCIYKDDFFESVGKNLLDSDVILIAGTIKDRYFSAKIKEFYDRGFVNGHRPLLKGKYLGYIVSGPFRQIPNMREILLALAQVSGGSFIDFLTDECEDDLILTSFIKKFAENIILRCKKKWKKPSNFLGYGGHLVFRDLVYRSKGILRADHIFYKKNNLYDYPQKNKKERLRNFAVALILRNKKARKKMNLRRQLVPMDKIIERSKKSVVN